MFPRQKITKNVTQIKKYYPDMASQKTKPVYFSTSSTLTGSSPRKGVWEYHESSYFLMNISKIWFLFFTNLIFSIQGPTWQSLSSSSLISALLLRQTLVIPSIVNITINIVVIVIILINIIVVVITNNMVNVTHRLHYNHHHRRCNHYH